jgi:hypothetical protein
MNRAAGKCVTPPIPFYCDLNQLCMPYQHDCGAAAPSCYNQKCGAQCGFCDYQNASCTALICDGGGNCLPPEKVTCGGYDACLGDPKNCGLPCSVCDPSSQNCDQPNVMAVCNESGLCSYGAPTCAYAPCVNHVCGQPCSICSPGDASCMAPPDPTFCTQDGACVPGPPMCPPPLPP